MKKILLFIWVTITAQSAYADPEKIKLYSDEYFQLSVPDNYQIKKDQAKSGAEACIYLHPKKSSNLRLNFCFYKTNFKEVLAKEEYFEYSDLPEDRKSLRVAPETGIVVSSGEWLWPTQKYENKFLTGINAQVECGEENPYTGQWKVTGALCYVALLEKKTNHSQPGTISINGFLKSGFKREHLSESDLSRIISSIRIK